MQNKNKFNSDLKRALIIISSVVAFFIWGMLAGIDYAPKKRKEKAKGNKEYFDRFNEHFQGVIVDIKVPEEKLKGGLKQCLLKVKLEYSTIKHYDPRDSLRHFYCVIDYPFAEVVEEYNGGIKSIGDSLIFDGIKDTCYIKVNSWAALKPNIRDNNIQLLKPFYTIPRYTAKQLKERKKTYPKPLELPNDYYMLLFGKFSKKEKLTESYKKLSSRSKYKGWTIPKYFERRYGYYYFFLSDKRYGSYKEVYNAWKEAGYSELYIAKFDKHNRFIKVLEKQKKK